MVNMLELDAIRLAAICAMLDVDVRLGPTHDPCNEQEREAVRVLRVWSQALKQATQRPYRDASENVRDGQVLRAAHNLACRFHGIAGPRQPDRRSELWALFAELDLAGAP